MTERSGWDDRRLANAFEALVDRRAPAMLTASIHDRLAETRPDRGWLASWGAPMAVGAIALAAIVVTGALVGSWILDDQGRGNGDAPSAGAPGPTAMPSTPAATPIPTAQTGWWPPVGAITFDLSSPVAAGAPPARLAVVDESERLTDVNETGDVDPSTVSFVGRFAAYAEPGHPGRVHLAWIGGICDSEITVTITAGIRSIVFDMGPQPDCDTMGVQRQVVLDFDRPVDVTTIELLDSDATPTPRPDGEYVLDCGSLGPDTCATKAKAIIDAQRVDHPSVQPVSIVFMDECGSYVARFDDGSFTGLSVDCVLP
jgi:hypothetical protein